jgi:hypothetical protein
MDIKFATVRQSQIADLMWEAQTNEEVHKLINHFGHDAVVVYHMMLAQYFDDIKDTAEASEILRNISNNGR